MAFCKLSSKLTEAERFQILADIPIDKFREMFNLSKINIKWKEYVGGYLQREFFVKTSLKFNILTNQLPEIYGKCHNHSVIQRWKCSNPNHISSIGQYVNNLQKVVKYISTFLMIHLIHFIIFSV